MSIPKVVVPTYDLTLPSNGKKLSYRPFLVKEEKILLMAAASNDLSEIFGAIAQVISNCVLDKDFRVDQAAAFDVKFILINLRMASIGKKIDAEYTCSHIMDDGEPCNNVFSVQYDLEDVAVVRTEVKDKIIFEGGKMGVIMKPPRFNITSSSKKPTIASYDVLRDSIKTVFDETTTYDFSELTLDEQDEWIESLPKVEFDKLISYLEGLPTFEIQKKHTCEKCNTEHDIRIKDIQSFF